VPPTYDIDASFADDWKKLPENQKTEFKAARQTMKLDFQTSHGKSVTFSPSLRIKGVRGTEGVFEMTWAGDGRATFQYGDERIPGHPHIIWRRIGTHDIFKRP